MANGHAANFLTPKEIAAELGVNYRALMRKIARGEGPKFKRYGTRILIRKDWYQKWIDTNEEAH